MVCARFPNGIELRVGVELRTANGGRRLEGYAAKFGTEARVGSFHETIMPGAFSASLASGADILALVDHDPTLLLARTASGTLRLSEDATGLAFEIDLADTTLGRDVRTMAERRDLGGMSFGFRPVDEAWPAADRRELRAVDLAEISVVHAWPAYPSTEVLARARGGRAAPSRYRLWLDTV